MNIKGLTSPEISSAMKPYIVEYFQDIDISKLPHDLFAESYTLVYSEIYDILPLGLQAQYCDDDWFQVSSGDLENRIIILVADEQNIEALLLCYQLLDSEDITVIKDFTA